MVNQKNYEEMKLKQVHLSNELEMLERDLINYERALPESIKRTRSMMQLGYDVDDNGNIFSTSENIKYYER